MQAVTVHDILQARGMKQFTGDSAMYPDRKDVLSTNDEKILGGANGVKKIKKPPSWAWRSSLLPKSLNNMSVDTLVDPSDLKRIKRLGEGGYAVVDLCIYSSSKGQLRPVAVKQLRPDVLKNENDRQSFLKEAKLLKEMKHPCIVDFLGVGYTDVASLESETKSCSKDVQESVYLVQEFMDKGTLKNLVQMQMCTTRSKLYSNTQALKWALQIAQGIRYLHRSKPKVIHRDVKMENILLKENDDGEVVAKLADFGLCAMLEKDGTRINDIDSMNNSDGWCLASYSSIFSTQVIGRV